MPHPDTIPAPTQPDLSSLCTLRRQGGAQRDSIGRYSLTHGSQYRCSACDTWLCAHCGSSPVPDPAAGCNDCSAPQQPRQPSPVPVPAAAPFWLAKPAQLCGRLLKAKVGRCTHNPAEWPTIPGEPAPVRACWTHLSDDERLSCTRARGLRDAERAREWAAGAPERQRLAAEAEAERLARLAACPCAVQLPEDAGPVSTGYPFTSHCKECDSLLCASCGRVRVQAEGGQCETCRPQATTPVRAREGAAHYRITVGSLEQEHFEDAMGLLIRAGARNGGEKRVFAIDLPIGPSQAEAVAYLETCASASTTGRVLVELVPNGAQVSVDPQLPQPDLSGLGDIDSWWCANGYPARDKGRQPR